MDNGLEVHTALLAKLKEVCSVPVYDAVPRNSSYPYVELDGQYANDMNFFAGDIKDRSIYLSVWSEARGQAEVLGILKQIGELDQQELVVTSGQVASMRVTRTDSNRDADGVTYMGSATVRIVTKD